MLKMKSAMREALAIVCSGAAIGGIAWLTQSPDFAKALLPPEEASSAELSAMLEPNEAPDAVANGATTQPAKTPDNAGTDTAPKLVSVDDVADTFFGQPTVTFVDGRDQTTYESGHIPGAINIDAELLADEPETGAELLAKIPLSQVMIAYCSGGECSLSKTLAENLVQRGYTKVLVFEDGWDGWVQEGLPEEEGPMATGESP